MSTSSSPAGAWIESGTVGFCTAPILAGAVTYTSSGSAISSRFLLRCHIHPTEYSCTRDRAAAPRMAPDGKDAPQCHRRWATAESLWDRRPVLQLLPQAHPASERRLPSTGCRLGWFPECSAGLRDYGLREAKYQDPSARGY